MSPCAFEDKQINKKAISVLFALKSRISLLKIWKRRSLSYLGPNLSIFAVLWIQIVYPGSRILFSPSQFSDPGSRSTYPTTTKKGRGNKFCCCLTFIVAVSFTNLSIILFLKRYLLTKFEPTDKELKYQKFVTGLSEIWVRNPGSGSRSQKHQISDPRSATLHFCNFF